MSLEARRNIWGVTTRDQFRTIDELLQKSVPNAHYFTLLLLSALIITAGILLGSEAIVIGGMLVTPLLMPILVIALGIITSAPIVTRRSFVLVGKSFLYVLVGAFVISILFGEPEKSIALIDNTLRTGILYLVIAVASGIAATYAWVKKEASEALPGVAIAVSLVPPIAQVGIGLGTQNFDDARFFFFVFLVNLIGIIAGSMLVFSQLGFYSTKTAVEQKSEEVHNGNGNGTQHNNKA